MNDSNQEIERILPTGYKLFEYQIESELGVGGFGVTYLAEDTNLNTKVALKEYLPGTISVRFEDSSVHANTQSNEELYQWGLDSFLQEARTLASFKHPNIVRVLRFFEMNNTAYMVMEYEQGMSLKDYVASEGSPEESELVDMFIPLFKGLAVVHKNKFLHRDIKPDNIIVRQDNTMVLLDFGSARQSTDDQSEANGLTTIVSPGYAPLEQYDRHGNQGPWSDIYALGGVMYWLIDQKAPDQSLYRMSEDPLIPAQEIGKGRFSKQYLKAIDWALSVQASKRPQTLEQFIAAITGQEVDLSINQSPVRIGSTPESSNKGNKLLWSVFSILFILMAGMGGYFYWEHIKSPQFATNISDSLITEGEITWQKTFGGANDDKMVAIEALPAGGSISVGWTKSAGKGGTDIFAVKLDKNGRVIWEQTYGGTGNESPEDLKIFKDGSGALISGKTSSKGKGGLDIWVFKINNEGEIVWENTFGGVYDEVPGDIKPMSNGNYLIAAYTQSKGAGSEDIWMFEANIQGEIIWEKTFGGVMSDIPDDLKALEDGSYLMTGWQDSKGAGGFDAWIIKLDSQGEKIWGRTYGGTGDDIIETMHLVSDGILLAGRTDSKGSGGGTDAWLMKVDNNGETIWEKTYGWGKYDDFRDIENATDGSLIISGITHSIGQGSSDIWVLNVDLSGEVIWVKTFGGNSREDISDFETTKEKDGGLIFAGGTRSQGAGGWDGWVFRSDVKETADVKEAMENNNNY